MGGSGSGTWWRWRKKKTVDESFVVSMKDLRDRLFFGSGGLLTRTWEDGGKSSISYHVTFSEDRPTVHLHYRLHYPWRGTEDVSIPIRLEATPTQFNGRRWWFICPLIVRGIACNRRAGKLYRPPWAKYFGCRKCHNLTYRSCQRAHQSERRWDRMHRVK